MQVKIWNRIFSSKSGFKSRRMRVGVSMTSILNTITRSFERIRLILCIYKSRARRFSSLPIGQLSSPPNGHFVTLPLPPFPRRATDEELKNFRYFTDILIYARHSSEYNGQTRRSLESNWYFIRFFFHAALEQQSGFTIVAENRRGSRKNNACNWRWYNNSSGEQRGGCVYGLQAPISL